MDNNSGNDESGRGFGERLAQARRLLGVIHWRDVRPADLAEMLDTSTANVSRWEGSKRAPRDETLELLAAFFRRHGLASASAAWLRYGVGGSAMEMAHALVTQPEGAKPEPLPSPVISIGTAPKTAARRGRVSKTVMSPEERAAAKERATRPAIPPRKRGGGRSG